MVIALFDAPFLFLRHGQTDLNAADLICGSGDAALNATGRAQAEAAARALDGVEIAAIWSSPLRRARDTAEAVARRRGLAVTDVAGIAERNWGAWEGLPRAHMQREETPPGGEGPQDFHARVLAGLARITPPFPVLVVGHSGTARVLAAALCPDADLPRAGNAEPVLWRKGPRGWRPGPLSPDCQKTAIDADQPPDQEH